MDKVSDEAAMYRKLAQQADENLSDAKYSKLKGRSDLAQRDNYSNLEQKQEEIDWQHRATVSRIKSEIWSDRVNFL